jgi:hypothetical protein
MHHRIEEEASSATFSQHSIYINVYHLLFIYSIGPYNPLSAFDDVANLTSPFVCPPKIHPSTPPKSSIQFGGWFGGWTGDSDDDDDDTTDVMMMMMVWFWFFR